MKHQIGFLVVAVFNMVAVTCSPTDSIKTPTTTTPSRRVGTD